MSRSTNLEMKINLFSCFTRQRNLYILAYIRLVLHEFVIGITISTELGSGVAMDLLLAAFKHSLVSPAY